MSQFYAELDGQGTLGEVQTITVPEGSSVSSIATQLKDSGVIQYDWLFKQYVKYSGKAGRFSTAALRSSPAWPTTRSSRPCPL